MNQFKTFISKEELNTLPLMEQTIPFQVVENQEHCLEAVKSLSSHQLLGFDTETRPSFTKGEMYQVSMLQLASIETTYLFRLNKIGLPPALIELLSNKQIAKLGVGIKDDIKGLQKLSPFEPNGFLDIAQMLKQKGFESLGLRALTGIFLQRRISKKAKTTNWERVNLTPIQLSYAALDAEVGLKIYHKMLESGLA